MHAEATSAAGIYAVGDATTTGFELTPVAIAAGRRPMVLFGTKEQEENRTPLFLPPLLNSTFDKYAPEAGALTKEDDRVAVLRQQLSMCSQMLASCASGWLANSYASEYTYHKGSHSSFTTSFYTSS